MNGAEVKGPMTPAGEGEVRQTKMGELMTKSQVEINRLQDISQRIYTLYASLFGEEPSNEEDSGATVGPASTMDSLLTMSHQRSSLIDDISDRLERLSNELRE